MNYVKLQFGCLLIMLYIICIYVKESLKTKIKCNKIFDSLLYVCPWAVVFDGLTAWSVNNQDIVPDWMNLLFHALFYLLMNVSIVIAFIYMMDITTGLPKKRLKKTKWSVILSPGVISTIVIIAFLYRVRYIIGDITNYSMGISPITCYVSMIVHFGIILFLAIFKYKTIERRKYVGMLSFIILSFILLIIQSAFPEALISSLLPTLIIIGFYINTEDPSIRLLENYNDTVVMGFSTLVENRDDSTGDHIKRTKGYVEIILNAMKNDEKYRKVLTKDYYRNIINAAPMHDIGKISTPDTILKKPGKLTSEEFDIMKDHARRGGEIILETFKDLDEPEYLKIAYEVSRFHHEKWNGRGYPDGLKEEEIPLHSRIMAIADVFDAVSAKRCYRDALPLDECFRIIEDGRGRDFDPRLTDLFLSQKEEVIKLYNKEK